MSQHSNYKVITGWDSSDGFCLVIKDKVRKVIRIKNEEWYFYISLQDSQRNDVQHILRKFGALGIVNKIMPGKRYARIYANRITRGEATIDQLRDALELVQCSVFEFDVQKYKRYMIDNNVPIEDNYDILYFDIETDDSNGGIEVGRDRIISWAAKDNKGKEYYAQGPEKEILQKFINVIKKYDIITGWNSDGFDLPYIQIRAEKHELSYNWKSIIHIDMLQRCFKIFSYEAPIIGLRSFSLNEISKTFLGEEKTELEGVKIWELEKNNPELLKEYNKRDVELLYLLDTKLSILPLMIQECVWTGSFLNKFYIGELLDNYILREAKKRQLILSSKPSKQIRSNLDEVSVTGGYVMKPLKGYYKDVHVCDFKSLYPSIIVGWNIGSDSLDLDKSKIGKENLNLFLGNRKIEDITFTDWHAFLKQQKESLDPNDECIQTANNSFFSRQNSFIGDLVENLLNERKEYKKKLKVLEFDTKEYNNTYAAERVVKEMANSMFGITCDKNSRYFNEYVSEGITYTGQYLNKLSTNIAHDYGLKAIYGDTDSIFLTNAHDMDSLIIDINASMAKNLDSNFNLRKNIVSLEYEKLFSHFILLEKKRYTGLLSMKDGKEIHKKFSRGTEDVKKSYIIEGKEQFKALVDLIYADTSIDSIIQYVLDLKKKVLDGKIDLKRLLLTTKVTQDPSKYKVKQAHVRLAEKLIAEKKILPIVESEKKMGTRLEYLMIGSGNKNEAVRLEEYEGGINLEYYWQKQIYAPLLRVLDVAHPTHDWLQYLKEPKVKKVKIEKVKKTKMSKLDKELQEYNVKDIIDKKYEQQKLF